MLRFFEVLLVTSYLIWSTSVNAMEETRHQLAFTMPAPAVLRAAAHKVFAHYFTQFPRSFDNLPPSTDYYASQYLMPSGEDNKFLRQGGFLRQRPLSRAVVPGSEWEQEDLRWEVQTAAAIGIDGFCLNLLETHGVHWKRAKALLSAAAASPGFSIMLMPDITSAFQTPQEVVDALVELGASPAALRLADGRLVVAPYCAQIRSSAWWQSVMAGCTARSLPIALFPVLQSLEQHFERFAPLSVGLSEWGMRTPARAGGRADFSGQAHRRGVLWMEPVAPQDMRAKDLFLFEAGNTSLFRTMWTRAIERNADWVQLITWNDYSEATEIAPSSGTGWLFMDLTAWYIARFKTGQWPTVVRDAAWLVHRTQRSSLQPTRQEQAFHWRDGEPLDEVEAVLLLQAPAEVRLVSGEATSTTVLPAGLSRMALPLSPGRPHLTVRRNGQSILRGESAWPVIETAPYQDLLYRGTAITGVDP